MESIIKIKTSKEDIICCARESKIIEDSQHPNRQGLDPYTLEEIMDLYGVPGVSIAVIKDFKIHCRLCENSDTEQT